MSSPQKLMNTSYTKWGSDFRKDDEDEEANSIKGIESQLFKSNNVKDLR